MFCRCLTHGALIRDKDRIPFGWCFRTHPSGFFRRRLLLSGSECHREEATIRRFIRLDLVALSLLYWRSAHVGEDQLITEV